ncbi:beta-ketoacyl synthase N-terminal-like domain-containing protein [Corallococcus llansteffanensis]|uniref:Aminotransferase class I/II-fold pyridoxal phosphate-dependent enzyme n=1 Tax=Corallococcus llansteffanensis TaxID=2316731 RepID=A0A3A8QUT7_9BACT|nr:beta-ketoacyl synthase N-terminal-like domain-containing protein [Corallococcus llansteffanensis]RKH68632.1 aminotransferase class I/II-fold pyridoxal phosphate-dependent enzyme [Corallococcus llansteffanensis]
MDERDPGCAIIGFAARFPGGSSPQRFWELLEEKGTFIAEMTEARRRLLFPGDGPKRGAAGLHGMFLDDVDTFDRRLFGLSPPGAMFADPRQRLLLEMCWAALEDAGLKGTELAGRRVGVFVAQDAWYWGSYADTGHADYVPNQEFLLPGNNPSFLANRVSSAFDFRGPSLVFNTTCSSVYVALHHARASLLRGECDYALVGGVTVMHRPPPDRFESPSNTMQSFAVGADGYVSSEGCGAFVLRRADAETERRHAVHGVLRGSGCNSGGRTKSFAQPSQAQLVALLRETLESSGLSAEGVDYVEAHGIASHLGDAIEANALIQVFGKREQGSCHISTVKPNIGHAHAASGIYSVIKALLAFRHGRIPPIRGMAGVELNQAIGSLGERLKFAAEPVAWPSRDGEGRHVLLPSFGFSNVNAALVLREPAPARSRPARAAAGEKVAVCLSARAQDRLGESISRLHDFVDEGVRSRAASLDLAELAYTLQVGRESFEARFATVVGSVEELAEVLAACRRGESPPGTHRGTAARKPSADVAAAVEAAVEARDVARLAELWTAGAAVPWARCYGDEPPCLMHLPVYPFARERYWLPEAAAAEPGPSETRPAKGGANAAKTGASTAKTATRTGTAGADTANTGASTGPDGANTANTGASTGAAGANTANTGASTGTDGGAPRTLALADTSTPEERRFTTRLTGEDFFFSDHRVKDQPVLPGTAYLEIADAAFRALARPSDTQAVRLRNTTWLRPLVMTGAGQDVTIRFPDLRGEVALEAGRRVRYEIYTRADDAPEGEAVHASGVVELMPAAPPERLDLDARRAAAKLGTIDADACYRRFREMGLNYGPLHRGVERIEFGDAEALARLTLPAELFDRSGKYVLHPGLLDSALQTFIGVDGANAGAAELLLPFALDELDVCRPLEREMFCWVRPARSGSSRRLRKFDLDVASESGELLVRLRGFSLRSPNREATASAPAKKPAPTAAEPVKAPPQAESGDPKRARAVGLLCAALAKAFRLAESDLSVQTPFRDLGMDSLLASTVTKELEKHFGSLPRTLFFEYETVGELADFLLANHSEHLDRAPERISTDAAALSDPLVDKAAVASGSELHHRLEALGATRLQNSVLFEMWPQLYLSPGGHGCLHVSRRGNRVFATGQGYSRESPGEDALVEEFAAWCSSRGWTPCYLGMTGKRGAGFESRTRMVSLPVGCFQTIAPLSEFTLAGSRMNRLRYMVQRFRKIENQKTVEYTGGDRATDDAIRAVILAWSTSKRIVANVDVALRDMSEGVLYRRYRVFLTYIGETLQNIIMILPVEGGYLMDLEYYLPDMPLGGTESAAVQIIETLRAEGHQKFSLGLTWGLFDVEGDEVGSDVAGQEFLARGAGMVAAMLRNGQQNHQHKNKYRPGARPMYLYRPADSDTGIIEKCLGEFLASGIDATDVQKLVDSAEAPPVAAPPAVEPEPLPQPPPPPLLKPRETAAKLARPAPQPPPEAAEAPNAFGGESAWDLFSDSWPYLDTRFVRERMEDLRRRSEASGALRPGPGFLDGRPHVLTTSGRLAERLFFRTFRSKRRKVLQNVLFETTLHNQVTAGFEAVEIPDPRIFETRSEHVFRGGLDRERLLQSLRDAKDEIALVFLELCNNASGGYPVSLEEIRTVARACGEHGVPLAIDITRIVRNAELIRRHEPGQAERSVWDIVDEIMGHATFAIGSLCKDFAIDVGGVIVSRDQDFLQRLAAFGKLEGGLTSPKQERLIAAALSTRDHVAAQVRAHLDLSSRLHQELARRGAPVVQPGGGHCIVIRANQVPGLEREQHPQEALLKRLARTAGIRGAAHLTGNQRDTSLNGCVRLALPLGLPGDGLAEQLAAALAPAATQEPETAGRRRQKQERRDVAIIGMSARYPSAPDLDAYWQNLASGKSSIGEIPPSRWEWQAYFEADPAAAVAHGKSYGRWGAFLDDVERFDPLFFGIAPKDAEDMDPQERIFLESAWAALEDAGYSSRRLSPGQRDRTGVFAGVTNAIFDDGSEGTARQCSFSRLVNRVSHQLDLGGPSLAIDNLCSSSLVAIHEACEYIRRGRGDMALAGAVNLNLHPGVYVNRSREGLLSPGPRCAAFEKGGTGYVPGEGVGVLVLKEHSAALRDGDHIYAVIRGSAVNHSGRMNAFGVANPRRQAAVITEALALAGVEPRTISYIEAAAAGVELSDSIEMAALDKVFGGRTGGHGTYAMGSVKPNVGHCEAAAGMSQVMKAVLCLANRKLAPTLLSGELNPDIHFERFPFRLQRTLSDWERVQVDGREVPRRAGVTSTGAAGVNAHLILEEHEAPGGTPAYGEPGLFVLSARNPESLKRYVERWIDYLAAPRPSPRLADIAYTLQVGRDEMPHRLAVVASDTADLLARLRAWRETGVGTRPVASEPGGLDQVAARWMSGAQVDWESLHRGAGRRRVAGLPSYPFARRDCGGLWRKAPPVAGRLAAAAVKPPGGEVKHHGHAPAPQATSGAVVSALRTMVERILGLTAEDAVADRTSFSDMGFNSLKLAALVDGLNQRFGLSLSRTTPFDYPDIESMAAHVSAQSAGRGAGNAGEAVDASGSGLGSILEDFVNRRAGLDQTLDRLDRCEIGKDR